MGRPFLWPVVGSPNSEPAPEVLACALGRSVGPALLFFLSLGATKGALARLSSLRCDQLSLGTTELLSGFNGRLLEGQPWAGSDEHSGPGAGLVPFLNDGLLASSPQPSWSRSWLGWAGSTNAARAGEQCNEPDEPRGSRNEGAAAQWRARAWLRWGRRSF